MENPTTQELLALLKKETERLEKQARAQISFRDRLPWSEDSVVTSFRIPKDMLNYLNSIPVATNVGRSKIMLQFLQAGIDNFRNQASQETLNMVDVEYKKLTSK